MDPDHVEHDDQDHVDHDDPDPVDQDDPDHVDHDDPAKDNETSAGSGSFIGYSDTLIRMRKKCTPTNVKGDKKLFFTIQS